MADAGESCSDLQRKLDDFQNLNSQCARGERYALAVLAMPPDALDVLMRKLRREADVDPLASQGLSARWQALADLKERHAMVERAVQRVTDTVQAIEAPLMERRA